MTNIETKNRIPEPGSSIMLIVIGWIIIAVGIIAGLISTIESGFLFLVFSFGGLATGTLFIGLGKIIELLTYISNKDYKIVETTEDSDQNVEEA